MRYNHIILISNSYTLGHRIAWHYSSTEPIADDIIKSIREKTIALLGKPYYSVHRLTTTSDSWDSIIAKDSYFADLVVTDRLEKFLLDIKKDFTITALDVAKYLLAHKAMSHLKLQKLIYFVYAEYLVKYGKALFSEPILAYKHGPVVREIYDIYKNYGARTIEPQHVGEAESDLEPAFDIDLPIVYARLAKTANKDEVIDVLESVLTTYGPMNPWDLVALTHRENTPWSKTAQSQKISDELILEYHKNEIL
ncbi:MAG: DUF4065 domain-containing protein [Veillonella sp.]|nr:DUF4065 domain-containing protein [Veillonella sp.]